jgi:hypothetical protein
VLAAYGLALGGDIAVLGASDAPEGSWRGEVAVSRGAEAEPAAFERIFAQGTGPDGPLITLDRTVAGYELRIAGFASFQIAPDGRRVGCRPEIGPAWRWQRVLAGHALPFAAVLQGIEVLHAGAVALGGRAIAIVANSHGGKSSLAVNLALRSARLLTDDALAVESHNGCVLAHPGVGAVTIRMAEVEQLKALGLFPRLDVLGEHGDVVRVLMDRQDEPVPLAACYWPERVDDGPIRFERLAPDPRRVLTSTINLVLRDPERLARHFAISTEIASTVPLYRAQFGRGVGAAELAAAIEAHALKG